MSLACCPLRPAGRLQSPKAGAVQVEAHTGWCGEQTPAKHAGRGSAGEGARGWACKARGHMPAVQAFIACQATPSREGEAVRQGLELPFRARKLLPHWSGGRPHPSQLLQTRPRPFLPHPLPPRQLPSRTCLGERRAMKMEGPSMSLSAPTALPARGYQRVMTWMSKAAALSHIPACRPCHISLRAGLLKALSHIPACRPAQGAECQGAVRLYVLHGCPPNAHGCPQDTHAV